MFTRETINSKDSTQAFPEEIQLRTKGGWLVLSLRHLEENQFLVSSRIYGAYDGFSKTFSDYNEALCFFNEVENAIILQDKSEREYFDAQDRFKQIQTEYDLARKLVLDLTKPF